MNWSVEETEYVLNTVFAKKKKKNSSCIYGSFRFRNQGKNCNYACSSSGESAVLDLNQLTKDYCM